MESVVATGMLLDLQEKWMDGKVARARRENDEKFQHNSVSTKNGPEKWGGGVPFIPLEAKGEVLDQRQVLVI